MFMFILQSQNRLYPTQMTLIKYSKLNPTNLPPDCDTVLLPNALNLSENNTFGSTTHIANKKICMTFILWFVLFVTRNSTAYN